MTRPGNQRAARAASNPPPVSMTKADVAYGYIRRQILEGDLAPGALIDQEMLAEELGLSTTPVREALRRLESERLVITRAHRDTVVAPASIELLEQIYTVRLALDPLAVSLTAAVATDDEIADIQQVLTEALEHGSPAAYLVHNRDLHREIYRLCGNEVLVQTLDSLWDLSDRYRMITLKDDVVFQSATDEHMAIVKAISERDGEQAARLMRDHVSRSLDNIRTASIRGAS